MSAYILKPKLIDPYTGVVIQEQRPYTPEEIAADRAARQALMAGQGMAPAPGRGGATAAPWLRPWRGRFAGAAMGAAMGGGGRHAYTSGGGSPAFGFASPEERVWNNALRSVDAHAYPAGTFTKTSRGAAPYHGLPRRANGGPVPPGQPFIAGDPQADGQPNPELIVPGPEGVNVVPLKDLPQLAYGTVEVRRDAVNLLHRGRPLEASRIAYDAEGRIVGASSGVPLPDAPPMAAGLPPAPGSAWTRESLLAKAREQMKLGNLPPLDFDPEAALKSPDANVEEVRQKLSEAWQRARREDGPAAHFPGVAEYAKAHPAPPPRQPLTPKEEPLGPSPVQLRAQRMMEKLARTPQGAMAITRGQQAAAEAEQQQKMDWIKLQEQRRMNDLAERKHAEDVALREAALKAKADAEAVRTNFNLAEESRRAAKFAQDIAPKSLEYLPAPGPQGGGVLTYGNSLASGYLPAPGSRTPEPGMMETAPGSGQYLRTVDKKPLPDLGTFEQTAPEIPPFSVGKLPMPGRPASYAPIKPDAKTAKGVEKPLDYAAKITAINRAISAETDEANIARLKKQKQRLYDEWDAADGVLGNGHAQAPTNWQPASPLYQGGPAPSAPAAPATAPSQSAYDEINAALKASR